MRQRLGRNRGPSGHGGAVALISSWAAVLPAQDLRRLKPTWMGEGEQVPTPS